MDPASVESDITTPARRQPAGDTFEAPWRDNAHPSQMHCVSSAKCTALKSERILIKQGAQPASVAARLELAFLTTSGDTTS